MIPKFLNQAAWQQAELLMQPVFIRVIDNIRKQLEQSTWKGSYRNTEVWAESVSAETQMQVTQLQKELTEATPEHAEAIQQKLEQLPQPFPGYELCLEKGDRHIAVDLWELCYCICFQNYQPDESQADGGQSQSPVVVDHSLIDDQGEVDWHQLDAKTKERVSAIFAKLPAGAEPVE
ncbi:MAG: hypothetical protein WBA57_11245 [Elainellaceae cyanobacterium]